MADDLDPVWKALSDPTRRAILDLLRQGPRRTTEIVDAFPHLSRFGVMKHIEVLRGAGLINTREEGRQRVNSLNAVPIRRIYERWVSRYEGSWADTLLRLKHDVEADRAPKRGSQDQQPDQPHDQKTDK
jgi:DNA-binding transcriptional ArsR family regulator